MIFENTGGYITVRKEQILMQGITRAPRGGHSFIVYENDRREIHVNAGFSSKDGVKYKCCAVYDRKLCDDCEALRQMTYDRIEAQAYNAYMDGAR